MSSAVGGQQASCKLVPPCTHGNHGLYISSKGDHTIKTIGKYYFTEEALEHDLAALRKGDIYDRDEFFKRAKAWYKAEIDRLLHLQSLEQCAGQEKARNNNSTDLIQKNASAIKIDNEAVETSKKIRTSLEPAAAAPAIRPTRIQPDRAAKRKFADPRPHSIPPKKRPPKHKPEKTPAPALAPTQVPQCTDPNLGAQGETRGDYTLAAYDWGQFLKGNNGEHRHSPWSYLQLQGLDVAYFGMRLERAVARKIDEILARDDSTQEAATDVKGEVEVLTNEQPKRAKSEDTDLKRNNVAITKPKRPSTQLHIHSYMYYKPRCALGYRYQKPAPFEPAAALAPGEDWRPPVTSNTTTTTGLRFRTQPSTKTDQKTDGITPSNWAANKVTRREKTDRRIAEQSLQRAAPEAEMEISPTLGRWGRRRSSGWPTGTGMEVELDLPMEDLGANVLEVSGLRFAVDLCACSMFMSGGGATSELGAEADRWEGARFLML